MQHQVLSSDHWTALVTGLRQPGWTATGLRKGVQHVFRVLSTTIKSSSKPSPPSEPVQLLDRGEPGVLWGGGESYWARELGVHGGGSRAGVDVITRAGLAWLGATPACQSASFLLLKAAHAVGKAEALVSNPSSAACFWLSSLDKSLNLSEPRLPRL